MTDRELLELAAKAAGYKTIQYEDLKSNGLDVRYGIDEAIWNDEDYWNPLTDDGAALRLAVKLGLCVKVDKRAGFTWIKKFEGGVPHNNDPYAATRRAIVRVAAAIGKEQL